MHVPLPVVVFRSVNVVNVRKTGSATDVKEEVWALVTELFYKERP